MLVQEQPPVINVSHDDTFQVSGKIVRSLFEEPERDTKFFARSVIESLLRRLPESEYQAAVREIAEITNTDFVEHL